MHLLIKKTPPLSPVLNSCNAQSTGKLILVLEVLNISRGAYSHTLLDKGKFR